MKLVEKKCPNCGGDLKFGIDDKETKCEYCNKAYEIERENDDEEEMFNADNYKFIEEKAEAAKAVIFGFAAAQMIPIFIFAFFFIAIVGTGIFFGFKHDTGSSRIETKRDEAPDEYKQAEKKINKEILRQEGYVVEFSGFEEKDLKEIHSSTLATLNNSVNRHENFIYKHSNYEYVGMYLLLGMTGNSLYDVYKIVFNVNGTDKEYYSAVRYTNIKKNNGKLIANLEGYEINPYNSNGNKSVLGYESCQELFNKNVRGKLGDSELEVSGSVYND